MRYVVAILSAVVLLPGLADAQAPGRTPWGDPDLQGIWTNRTTTAARATDRARRGARCSPTRSARPLDAEADAARDAPPPPGRTGGYNDFWLDRGVRTSQTSLIVDPPDGRYPREDGARARERRGVRGDARRHAVRHLGGPEPLRPAASRAACRAP